MKQYSLLNKSVENITFHYRQSLECKFRRYKTFSKLEAQISFAVVELIKKTHLVQNVWYGMTKEKL